MIQLDSTTIIGDHRSIVIDWEARACPAPLPRGRERGGGPSSFPARASLGEAIGLGGAGRLSPCSRIRGQGKIAPCFHPPDNTPERAKGVLAKTEKPGGQVGVEPGAGEGHLPPSGPGGVGAPPAPPGGLASTASRCARRPPAPRGPPLPPAPPPGPRGGVPPAVAPCWRGGVGRSPAAPGAEALRPGRGGGRAAPPPARPTPRRPRVPPPPGPAPRGSRALPFAGPGSPAVHDHGGACCNSGAGRRRRLAAAGAGAGPPGGPAPATGRARGPAPGVEVVEGFPTPTSGAPEGEPGFPRPGDPRSGCHRDGSLTSGWPGPRAGGGLRRAPPPPRAAAPSDGNPVPGGGRRRGPVDAVHVADVGRGGGWGFDPGKAFTFQLSPERAAARAAGRGGGGRRAPGPPLRPGRGAPPGRAFSPSGGAVVPGGEGGQLGWMVEGLLAGETPTHREGEGRD